MIRENYEAICAGKDVRANLIALKEALREEEALKSFAYLLGGDFSVLCALLSDRDPKVRKNAVQLLGRMESEDLLPVLFDAYQKEETRYLKADYVRAMARMNCRAYAGQLEERLIALRHTEPAPEEEKHMAEEIRALQDLLLRYQRHKKHAFAGYQREETVILVTNREQREVTARQIPGGQMTMLRGGIRVSGVSLEELLPIRTYTELLFPLATGELRAEDPALVGEQLAKSSLTELMDRLHKGGSPYRFRVELRSPMEPDKRGAYIRKLADALERSSDGAWINAAGAYEAELRLVAKKDGTYAALLKLGTIPERRFGYRKEFIASSITPVNAALAMELAKPWLKAGAQVLDPFCGVGTMLVERAQVLEAGPMYGLDIFADAVEKARRNTAASGCRVNYINRDFFTFTHDFPFDEIVTDMPQVTSARKKEEIRLLYQDFFEKAPQHFDGKGILVLYTTEPGFAREAIQGKEEYRLEKSFVINERNRTEVLIIQYEQVHR